MSSLFLINFVFLIRHEPQAPYKRFARDIGANPHLAVEKLAGDHLCSSSGPGIFYGSYPLKLLLPWGSSHLLQTKLPMLPKKWRKVGKLLRGEMLF